MNQNDCPKITIETMADKGYNIVCDAYTWSGNAWIESESRLGTYFSYHVALNVLHTLKVCKYYPNGLII